MALSKQQIDELFYFTEKKFVKWYDLQIELVDHLANKIEDELEQNPNKNFEDALKKVYASFGIFGFARIVREKEEQVRKFNKRLWITEFKNLFVWPNVLKSLSVLLFLKLLIDYIPLEYLLSSGVVIAITHASYQYYEARKRRIRNVTGTKKLLLTQFLLMPNLLGYLYFQIWVNLWRFEASGTVEGTNKYWLLGIVFLITLSYIASVNVARKIYVKAKNLYPEFFAVAN